MDILQFPDFIRGTVKSSDTDPESSEVTVRTLTLVATSGTRSGDIPGHSERSSEQVLNAKVTKRLPTRRPQIRVYQVELSDEHDVPCGTAVCKIAWDPCIPSLAHEVQIYQTKLKALQSTVVPRVYGSYIGRVDGELAHVLLEECCGPSSGGACFRSEEFRKDILVAAFKLHAAGVTHNDIEYLSRTIALGPPPAPVARFVGFDKAEAHDCPLVNNGVAAEDIKADIQ
ncbi:hypothetical protein K466DRAFT_606720, partial [Polyporus arcularius HHB13444]